MHQNAPFIPLNIKNGLPKEGGTPLLQPPPPRVLRLLVSATPFPPILAKFPSILKLIYIPVKVNNNRVMCQMSMKLPAMFDQNPPHTFDKIVKKLITTKNALKV